MIEKILKYFFGAPIFYIRLVMMSENQRYAFKEARKDLNPIKNFLLTIRGLLGLLELLALLYCIISLVSKIVK